jgi:arylsulfatase/uncharacterized sulfatase
MAAEIADSASRPSNDTSQRPNIVLVLADDLGFSDLGSYGSEISTPNLDAIAKEGLRFSNYHTAANCAPARAMLLTGVDAHLAGVPNIPEMLPPELKQYEQYQGVLGGNVVTVATLLEDAGYHTYLAGKWHLGAGPGKLPSERGFERTVALADSGADNWEQRPYIPLYDAANWYADGEPYQLPDNFYSSRFLVDKTIEFIDGNLADGEPFFAYLPLQAVHIPVQAPQIYIDRYMGVYDEGWDVLREARRSRSIELGLVPPETDMVRMSTTDDWSALSDERRRYESKRMAVYGAMVEAMDHHLGRLFDHLKSVGEYDNTLIIFTSDNGAEASGSADPSSFAARQGPNSVGYNIDYESLGLRGSYNTISPSFASAATSPLSLFKFYAGEGGMRVPLILSGPSVTKAGEINHSFAFVTDITPTLLSVAGVTAPRHRYRGRPVEPMVGRDLMPLITGEVDRVYEESDSVGYELAGHAALFQGDYKLLFTRGALGDGQWHLYDIVRDPGETHDLAALEPARLQTMLSAYQRYVRNNKVLEVPASYSHTKQVLINVLYHQFQTPVLIAMLTALILLPFWVAYLNKEGSN